MGKRQRASHTRQICEWVKKPGMMLQQYTLQCGYVGYDFTMVLFSILELTSVNKAVPQELNDEGQLRNKALESLAKEDEFAEIQLFYIG